MSAQAWQQPGTKLSLCVPWVVTEATQSPVNAGCRADGGFVWHGPLRDCIVSIVLTSDASRRRPPPSSSSCYHSNVWELQSWTKTPLNYLKWSNSTASALTGLLSLQMDILYLALSNVSIWALIFHGEQLLFWCLAVGKLPPQGNRRGQTLPGKPRASGESRRVP